MTEPDHELTKEEQWKQMEAQAVAEMEAQERRRQEEEAKVKAEAEAKAKAEAEAKAKAEAEAAAKAPKIDASGKDIEALGSLLADAAKAMGGGRRFAVRDVALLVLLFANLGVMAFFLARSGTGAGTPVKETPAVKTPAPGIAEPHNDFEDAIKAGREKRHDEAIRLLERHMKSHTLPAEELLLVYQQLALQCRLAGRMEESVRYGAFAQSLSHKAWKAEDLLDSATSARRDGRLVDARRILSRFLLMEGGLPPTARARVPKAILQLAETYQEEAVQKEGKKP